MDEREVEQDGKGTQKDITADDKIVIQEGKTISSFRHVFKSLGPGIITGASDDDPSAIATYSQAGAQFGFGMLWIALFQYPMMTVIQEICARIGLITGSGLNTVIKRKYSKKVVLPLTSLLLIANTINIGADIGARAASVRLVFPQLSSRSQYYRYTNRRSGCEGTAASCKDFS